MWLSKIKAVIGTAWLYVVAVLVVLLALAGRCNASLRAEIAKREAAREAARAAEFSRRAQKQEAARQQVAARRDAAQRNTDAGRRNHFESDK